MITYDNHGVTAICETCGRTLYLFLTSGVITSEVIAEAQDADACHVCEKDEEVTA